MYASCSQGYSMREACTKINVVAIKFSYILTPYSVVYNCYHSPQKKVTEWEMLGISRDAHMLFKVPIMLCSDSQHQANYAHHFVPIMLTIISIWQT